VDRWFTNLCDTKPTASAHERLSRVHFVINPVRIIIVRKEIRFVVCYRYEIFDSSLGL
jgi:hypothetical protein